MTGRGRPYGPARSASGSSHSTWRAEGWGCGQGGGDRGGPAAADRDARRPAGARLGVVGGDVMTGIPGGNRLRAARLGPADLARLGVAGLRARPLRVFLSAFGIA